MISDRVRGKAVGAGHILNMISRMMRDETKYDPETLNALAKKIEQCAFIGNERTTMMNYQMVNEPFEVAQLLADLNTTISTLWQMSDDDYYLDYIFNAGSAQNEMVKELGIDENWFEETAEKLEKLRVVLFGNNLNWDNLARDFMRCAAWATREENLRLEDYNKQLERKAEKADENRTD